MNTIFPNMNAIVILLAPFLLLLFVYLSGVGSRPKGYPPGPPTLPLIGNLHQMPKTRSHEQFQRWAQVYGPIYSLILGTQVMIVLSSDQAVKDILDKRSAYYSSRPEMYMTNVATGGLKVALMPYGDLWRTIRRCMHSMLNIRVANSYNAYQDLENKQMLVDLIDGPQDFVGHIRRYTDSVTTQMVFGYRATSKDEPHIKEFFENLHGYSAIASSSAAALLDVFPVLRYLPSFFFPMMKSAKAQAKKEKAFYVGGWLKVKEQIRQGTAKPCLSHQMLKAQETEGLSEDIAGYATGILHEGGSETSASTLEALIMALTLYPEVQQRAREELDRACPDRLPTSDDEANLPYVRAAVKEALRWFPALVLGAPHAALRDDEYLGYRIPAGATVLMNTWALNRDPRRYADPRVFDPARFLGDVTSAAESAASTDVARRDHFTFGAGRRVCPGTHVAERTLFLSVARLLWGFDVSKAKEEVQSLGDDGKIKTSWVEVTPDQDDVVDGLLNHPGPFPANIRPRSEKHVEVMRRAWADSQELLDEKGQWRVVPEGMFTTGYTASSDLGY